MKDSLSKEMQEIKELIGLDAFLKLIYAFDGSTVVFPTIKTVKYWEQREKAIQLLKKRLQYKRNSKIDRDISKDIIPDKKGYGTLAACCCDVATGIRGKILL